MASLSRIVIEIGDLFIRKDVPHIVWRTVRVVTPMDGIRHIYLERDDQVGTSKLLSYDVLANRREYQRVGFAPIEPPVPQVMFEGAPG